MIYSIKICAVCGNVFRPTSPNQKYCACCKDIGNKEKNRDRYRNINRINNNYKEYTKICPICNNVFHTFYSHKKYCGSSSCDIERKRRNGIKADKKRSGVRKKTRLLKKDAIKNESLSYIKDYFNQFNYEVLDTSLYVNTHNGFIKVRCPHGHIWYTTFHNFKDCSNRCLYCYIDNNYTSSIEQKVRDYFKSNHNDVAISYNDRHQISPKELDIFFPSYNVAVEICGLYWHSDTAKGISRNYHYDKMIMCYNKGIRLLTIFEDEINLKFEVVVSRIERVLGLTKNILHVRDCVVSEIDVFNVNNFLKNNYIKDSFVDSFKAFGLYYDSCLVAICSLSKCAFSTTTLKLNCFCCENDLFIVDAEVELFKRVCNYAVQHGYLDICASCDMRYVDIFDSVYHRLGFTLMSEIKYSSHYFINGVRCEDLILKETAVEQDFNAEELELLLKQGYNRIWDCGHRLYVFHIR